MASAVPTPSAPATSTAPTPVLRAPGLIRRSSTVLEPATSVTNMCPCSDVRRTAMECSAVQLRLQ